MTQIPVAIPVVEITKGFAIVVIAEQPLVNIDAAVTQTEDITGYVSRSGGDRSTLKRDPYRAIPEPYE